MKKFIHRFGIMIGHDSEARPPTARLGLFRLNEPINGICGVCGLIGDHEFFDVDLSDLVGAECKDEVRSAEIHARAYIAPFSA